MDARDRAFYTKIIQDERIMRGHGFGEWPDHDELVRYACGLEDAVRAVAARLIGVSRRGSGGLLFAFGPLWTVAKRAKPVW